MNKCPFPIPTVWRAYFTDDMLLPVQRRAACMIVGRIRVARTSGHAKRTLIGRYDLVLTTDSAQALHGFFTIAIFSGPFAPNMRGYTRLETSAALAQPFERTCRSGQCVLESGFLLQTTVTTPCYSATFGATPL